MPGKDIHGIPESSCFFQGHIGQFFSKSGYSFRIQSNYSDPNKLEDINTDKYKPIFLKIINRKIAARNSGGGTLQQVAPVDLVINAVKLIDDVEREDVCGIFEIYPRSGLCTKDGCNSYFEIDRGRTCGHRDDDPWEQFTFLAFCDECGRLLPLHYMTNVFNDCKKCGGRKTLTILRWGRNKDDMSSYRVKCKVCGSEESLYFYECDHTIRKTGESISSRPKKRFRGVPARAGAIIHPYVISIPDIPQEDEIDQSGRKNIQGRVLSEAFSYFFSYEVDGALLNLPEFQKLIYEDVEFWQLPRVKMLCEDKNLDLSDRENWNRNQLLKAIKGVIKRAKEGIEPDESNYDVTITNYGIDKIKRALAAVKDIDFDENDLQGIYLLDSNAINHRDIPKQPPGNYTNWLERFGLEKVIQISDLTIIQALLGIIEGSTRKEYPLFRPIETGRNNRKKPTVFLRNFQTEGVLFHLDYEKILRWLFANKSEIKPSIDLSLPAVDNYEKHYREIMRHDERCKHAVETLLHTFSHMLIQQSTTDTGLSIESLSELIYPMTASVLLYSTSSVDIGGIEFTYDYHLESWLKRMKELSSDCPQDPACMFDEEGACNACSYLPEFVCCNFNQNLDRSTLIGGSDRFSKGYLI